MAGDGERVKHMMREYGRNKAEQTELAREPVYSCDNVILANKYFVHCPVFIARCRPPSDPPFPLTSDPIIVLIQDADQVGLW